MSMARNAPEAESTRQLLEGVAQSLRPLPSRRQDMRLMYKGLGRYLRGVAQAVRPFPCKWQVMRLNQNDLGRCSREWRRH